MKRSWSRWCRVFEALGSVVLHVYLIFRFQVLSRLDSSSSLRNLDCWCFEPIFEGHQSQLSSDHIPHLRKSSSFRPVHRPTATGEEASRQPLLRSKEFGRPSVELLSPYGGFPSVEVSLDGVGQQMLETTMMLWWLRKTLNLALPGYWIFPEDFLEVLWFLERLIP